MLCEKVVSLKYNLLVVEIKFKTMSSARSKLIVYGWIFGILSIVFFVQVIFSIIVMSKEGTDLEEKGIATFYSICLMLFVVECFIACGMLITMWGRGYTIFIWWIVVNLAMLAIFWIALILQSGFENVIDSLCIFGMTFSDLILVTRNLKLSRDDTEEEALL
jgi:hypothetical protein